MKKIKLNRIFVIGATGSGKTTFAGKLSKISGIQTFDLDHVYFEKEFIKKSDPKTRHRKLSSILRKKKWIVDGVYTSWTSDIFKKADLVVCLDPPLRILSWRILRRYMDRRLKKILNEDETFKSAMDFVKLAFEYKNKKNKKGYREHRAMIDKYNADFVILRNSRQVTNFIKNFRKNEI